MCVIFALGYWGGKGKIRVPEIGWNVPKDKTSDIIELLHGSSEH
jgi:hypothetical protein